LDDELAHQASHPQAARVADHSRHCGYTFLPVTSRLSGKQLSHRSCRLIDRRNASANHLTRFRGRQCQAWSDAASTRRNAPVRSHQKIVDDDGLPKARPMPSGDSPASQRSITPCFSAYSKPSYEILTIPQSTSHLLLKIKCCVRPLRPPTQSGHIIAHTGG